MYFFNKKNTSFLFIVLLVLAGIWLILGRPQQVSHDPEVKPGVIEARGDLAADEKGTIKIFRSVSPSVVYITSIELRRGLFSLNVQEIPQGTGSGFIWDDEGRIVTNYHVIKNSNKVRVTLADNSTWKASLVGATPEKDIAVLQIDAPADKLTPITLGESSNLIVGQKVFAIGNPFGLDHTLTSGIVSALDREIKSANGVTIQGVIQTDAAINPGNSGGPLLDSAGRMIGINTAIYSPSGTYAGIGFAVPVDEVNRVVTQLIKHGHLIRAGLGVSIANDRLASRLGIKGALIVKVEPDGPAEEAGLRGIRRFRDDLVLGDVIVSIDGISVNDYDDLYQVLDQHKPGDKVTLKIVREGQEFKVEVELQQVGGSE
ncbi:MAG: S1C family serine protease [Desulfurivibrionaceae bacterium]